MTCEFSIDTQSAEQTIAAGRTIAAKLQPGTALILRGDLGAGKTTLVKGIAEGLRAADPEEVTSPTFTLVHEYAGLLNDTPVTLYHLDLYRLAEERDLATLGLDEILDSRSSIILVEWGEKFPTLAARVNGQIHLHHKGGDSRSIRVHFEA